MNPYRFFILVILGLLYLAPSHAAVAFDSGKECSFLAADETDNDSQKGKTKDKKTGEEEEEEEPDCE